MCRWQLCWFPGMAEFCIQKTSVAWNEATSRSNLGLFRRPSIFWYQMMMLPIRLKITMKLLVTNTYDSIVQGWRKLDPGTGDEAGTTEGAFHLWWAPFASVQCRQGWLLNSIIFIIRWEGDFYRGKNTAVATSNNCYLAGKLVRWSGGSYWSVGQVVRWVGSFGITS